MEVSSYMQALYLLGPYWIERARLIAQLEIDSIGEEEINLVDE